MIIIPTPCDACGGFVEPTDVSCDMCNKTQTIADFSGLIIHFSDIDEDESCNGDCQECQDIEEMTSHEFHFCDINCLSEYLADPNNDCFSHFEDKGLALYCDNKNASLLFYALRGGAWNE